MMLDGAAECAVPPDLGTQSCVMCRGNWHCSEGSVIPQCPAGFSGGNSCTGTGNPLPDGGTTCLAYMSTGYGHWWGCTNNVWLTTPELTPCSQ